MNKSSPAILFVGPPAYTANAANKQIQSFYCSHNGCGTCPVCIQIQTHNHHALVSIIPENRYTLETLEPIFKRMAFTTDEGQPCFFVIYAADLLSTACANSLLKVVEEPSPGYHFIFLTNRLQQVLPTIRSRCTVTSVTPAHYTTQNHPLFHHFSGIKKDVLLFQKELSAATIFESEALLLVDQLLYHALELFKQSLKTNNTEQQERARILIAVCKEALLSPPMPGSAKLFLKNIYLQYGI